MKTVSMITASKRTARQSALANNCRITININGKDQHFDYRDILVHLLFRIIDDMDWNENPLRYLREYFPDIEWTFTTRPFTWVMFPSLVPNAHFIFVIENGFIVATKKNTTDNRCLVISQSKFYSPGLCTGHTVIKNPMLGDVTIDSFNRQ